MTNRMIVPVICGLLLVACPARREGLSRDALAKRLNEGSANDDLPTVAALLQRRAPPIPAPPVAITGGSAASALAQGQEILGDDAAAIAARCLRADARREYDNVVHECLAAAEAQPDGVRAAIAVSIVARYLPGLSGAQRAAAATRVAAMPGACQRARAAGSCALLALTTSEFAKRFSSEGGLDPTSPPGTITSAHVDGPWVDAHESFVGHPRHGEPMRAHGRRTSYAATVRAGTLHASAGVSGWYRITAYAETARRSAVTLFVATPEPLEVRVDGLVVLTRPPATDGAEWEAIPLVLEAGGHDIDVMVYDRGRGVALMAIDDDGAPALVTSTKRWRQPAGAQRATGGPLDGLLSPATLDGGDARALEVLLWRQQARLSGLADARQRLSESSAQLLGVYGWSPVAAVFGALGLEWSPLPAKLVRAIAAPAWASVERAWPENTLVSIERARGAAEMPEAALPAYRALVASSPAYPVGRRELINQLLDRQLVDEALTHATVLARVGAPAQDLDAAVPAFVTGGRLGAAAAASDARAALRGREPRLARRLEQGDTSGVLADVRAGLVTPSIDGPTPLLDLLEVCCDADARHVVASARATRPLDDDLALRDARATGSLARVEEITRAHASLRAELLRLALGGEPLWRAALTRGDEAIANRRAGAPPFPDAALVCLLIENERHFAADGSSFAVRHWVMELRGKDALDAFGEVRRGRAELLVRLRVVKPDGREREPEHHAEVEDISLTGLAPGDIVEWLSVTATDSAPWETFSMSGSPACVSRRVALSWPEALDGDFQVVVENGAPASQRERRDGRVAHLFVANDAAELRDEPHQVARTEDEPQVGYVVRLGDDLHRHGAWLRALTSGGDAWLSDAAVELAGRGAPLDRLTRLYRFVAARITEDDNVADPIVTLATGAGQRLPLLLTLARSAGLSARHLAVHAAGAPALVIPTAASWSGAVVDVDVGDRHVIVASIDGGLLLDRLPSSFEDAATMDVESGARGVIPKTAIDRMPFDLRVELGLDDAGREFLGWSVVTLPASLAEPLRGPIRSASADQLARLAEAVLAASFPGVVASSVTLPGLDTPGGQMAIAAEIRVPLAEGTTRFEHLFAGGAAATLRIAPSLASYAQASERARTLLIGPHRERVEIVVRLPTAASVLELPPTAELIAGPIRLTQRAAVEDGAVVWEREIETSLARVKPASWPALRAGLAPLLAASDARLAILVAAAPEE